MSQLAGASMGHLLDRQGGVLRLKHVDVGVDFILEHSYARRDDVVIVAGTLVEGIGNACSDIDVYVITDAYRTRGEIDITKHHRVLSPDRSIIREDTEHSREVFLVHTVVPGTAIKVDVEFKTIAEIEELFRSIDRIFDYATQNLFLLTKRLTDREEAMVHRFFNCIPLLGEGRFNALRGRLSEPKYLYIGYRWIASDFNILLDLIGAWQAAEIDRAVEFARENVLLQTAAYLRLTGCTNYRRKWLPTYLKANGDDQLLAEFTKLTYLDGTRDVAGKIAYVHRALDYVDWVFDRSRPLLSAMTRVPSGREALELLERDRERTPPMNLYEAWEFQYRAKAYRKDPTPTRSLLGPFPDYHGEI
jgi:hypothetical protein